MSELNRRRFLERMTSLSATAMVAPAGLAATAPRASARSDAPTIVPRRSASRARGRVGRPLVLPDIERRQVADLTELTLVEAAAALRDREISAVELLEAYLDRIDRWDEAHYRAFNLVASAEAREAARVADAALAARSGAGDPLTGIPLAIKDNYFTAGVRTTANSYLYEDFVPDFDATSWARLRDAGAILLGKTQMGPLATTAASTPDGERTTRNAWAPFSEEVSPGGSSSGSATAVAGRMAASSTGTQTGGSITNPSNAQGLTGIKPTMGRVSLHGILPLTYTRDHPGPLARDAIDAAAMLAVMAGPDPADPRSMGLPPVPDYVAAVRPVDRAGRPALRRPLRVGVLPDFLREPEPPATEPEQDPTPDADRVGSAPPPPDRSESRYRRELTIGAARRAALRTLEELGAEVLELGFPRDWETLTSFHFNNVRLPERSEIFLEHLRDDVRKFGVSLSPWINGLLLPGAEYVRGQRGRLVLLRSILDDVFGRCDVVTQTAPFPFDMVGLPLIGFPIGFETESAGVPRPIGGMFGAEPYAEDRLLELVAAYQRVTEWHRRRPADPDELREASGSSSEPGSGRYDLFDVMERGE
ncbi:MAG: amidase [Gemmatimonadetes bacterium]|nr:amidase [Gemmatimonadota bacterium]